MQAKWNATPSAEAAFRHLSKIERKAFVVARLNTARVICASVVRTKHFKVYPLMLMLPLLLLLLLLLLMLLPVLLLFVVA